jgi:LysR family nitrogen assimilation transcriptional regulator
MKIPVGRADRRYDLIGVDEETILETRQLQVFVAVVESGSLSKAAITLSVTQPMITRHIRSLEDELGVELFYRNGRGVVLTEAGQLLKSYADEILDRVSHAKSEVSSFVTSPRGKLVLGVPPSVGTVLTVPLVKKIKNEFPNIALQVIEGFSGHILEWLTSGRVDAAVLYNSPNHPSVLTEPLVEDELFLIGPEPPLHDLPNGPVGLEWFAKLPMILPSRPHGLRRLIDKILAEHEIYPKIEMELEAMPSTLLLVEEGAGYTILPYASVHTLVEAGRLRVWPFDPAITRTLLLATSNQRPMSATIRTLIRTVRTEVRDVIATFPWKPGQTPGNRD